MLMDFAGNTPCPGSSSNCDVRSFRAEKQKKQREGPSHLACPKRPTLVDGFLQTGAAQILLCYVLSKKEGAAAMRKEYGPIINEKQSDVKKYFAAVDILVAVFS